MSFDLVSAQMSFVRNAQGGHLSITYLLGPRLILEVTVPPPGTLLPPSPQAVSASFPSLISLCHSADHPRAANPTPLPLCPVRTAPPPPSVPCSLSPLPLALAYHFSLPECHFLQEAFPAAHGFALQLPLLPPHQLFIPVSCLSPESPSHGSSPTMATMVPPPNREPSAQLTPSLISPPRKLRPSEVV